MANIMFVYVLVYFAVISIILLSSQSFGPVETTVIVFIGGFYLVREVLQFPLIVSTDLRRYAVKGVMNEILPDV